MNDGSPDLSSFFVLLVLVLGPAVYAYNLFVKKSIKRIDNMDKVEKELEKKEAAAVLDAEHKAIAEREESTRIYNEKERQVIDELNERYVEASDPDTVNKFLKEISKNVHTKKP